MLAQALHHAGTAERTAVVFYGAAALVIEIVLRGAQRYAASRPELQMEPSADQAEPTPARPHFTGWRAWVSTVLYAAAILFGVFLFPKVAVVGYLAVGIRSVFVVGQRGSPQSGLWLADPEAMEDPLVAASRSVWRRRIPT